MNAVRSTEVERAVEEFDHTRDAVPRPWVDIGQAHGAAGIALPELPAVVERSCREKDRAVSAGHGAARPYGPRVQGPGQDILQTGPSRRAVAIPQLAAVGAVVRGEIQRPIHVRQKVWV